MNSLKEDFNDFFEHALCGYVITDPEGKITRANAVLKQWLKIPGAAIIGMRLSDLLSIAGKIYYETHLWPLLRMQGYFDEVAAELQSSQNEKLPVLINGIERRDSSGAVAFIRFTIFKAADRRTYEQNLKESKANLELSLAHALQLTTTREQLIAILGHDLRNPLGSLITAAGVLSRSPLSEQEMKMLLLIKRSSLRMKEIIANIMDFTRTRLGDSLVINRQPTNIEPLLREVIDEVQMIYPNREIGLQLDLSGDVLCDGPRIAQLASNLLVNALTHGFPDTAVIIEAISQSEFFRLSITNAGHQIPPDQISKIFEPFTREEYSPGQNGLGLGLYIVSQIVKAHKGEITVSSTTEKTVFACRLPGS